MKICVSILTIIVLASNSSFGSEKMNTPWIVKKGTEWELQLPEIYRLALKDQLPGFEPFSKKDFKIAMLKGYEFNSKQIPFAVLGDFNGDKNLDLVLSGILTKNRRCLISMMNIKGKVKVEEINCLPSAKKNNNIKPDFVLQLGARTIYPTELDKDGGAATVTRDLDRDTLDLKYDNASEHYKETQEGSRESSTYYYEGSWQEVYTGC